MTRLPSLKGPEIIRALERGGFFVHRIKGSHHILKHIDKPELRVVVAHHRRDLPRGTVAEIIKQAGLTEDELIDLL